MKIKFRAFDTLSPKMYTGHSLSISSDGGLMFLDCDGQWKEDINSRFVIMQYTGFKDAKDREVHEGDVYFSETEYDEGDERAFYIVTWIKEWAMFALLSVSEYNEYLDTGIEHLNDEGVPYNLEHDSFNRLHYKGDIYTNPELLNP